MPGPLHPRATVLTVRSLSPADEDGVVGGEGYLYTYAAGQGDGPPTRVRQPAAPPAVEEEVGPWMMPMSQGRPPEEFAAAKQREAAESGGRRGGRPPPTLHAPAAAGAGTQAKLIAKHYNLFYLDTGKIYRYIGLLRLKNFKNFNYSLIKKKIKNLKIKDLQNKILLSDNKNFQLLL